MKYALIIGNDRYTDQKLAKLKTPASDSQALARVLKDQKIGSFDEVISLINKTEVQVSRAISAFLSAKKPEDLVLMYFSGHGVLDDRGRLFLALKDTQTSLLKSTAISSSFIVDEMDSCRSKRQILILDCCHSGAFERGVKAGEQRAITETTFEGSGFGRVVLAASDSTQYAFEGDQVIKQTELSLFTHFLLEGLQTGRADINNDGHVSLEEWYGYAYTKVCETTPKQVPKKWSYHQQGDIIIGRNPVWKKKLVELPEDLIQLLKSPYSNAREIGVKELGELLHSDDSAVAELARARLERLKNDDSRTVSLAAIKQLSGLGTSSEEEQLERAKAAEAEAEREAAEQARREQAIAEEVVRRKAQREANEKTKRENAERWAAQIAALTEISSKHFTSLKAALPKAKPFLRIAGIIGVSAVLLLIGSWVIGQARSRTGAEINTPLGTDISNRLPLVPTEAALPAPIATFTKTAPVQTESAIPPLSPVLGGADKIAFIANGDIWLMDVDGSNLRQLTNDGGEKTDLQWLPDGETITFITGLSVGYANIRTGEVETLTNFPSASSLNAFRVSHDGKQVMISLNNEIFVVPFDFNQMKNVHKKSDLLELHGCIYPDPNFKYSRLVVREALWSLDDQLVAWLFKGADATRSSRLHFDQVSVMDLRRCMSGEADQLDNFPAARFKAEDGEPVQYNDDGILSDIDWDGNDLFVFNTNRQKGWGELYVYNWKTHEPFHSNQVNGLCCYRDARWSPDGLYLFFAFQDQRQGAGAPTLLYYVLYRKGEGTKSPPLPLPEGFFKEREEAPQPALRSAQ